MFSSKDQQLAAQIQVNGKTRGAFTHTLLQGLRGQARDPQTGAITTSQLKLYVLDNMRTLLSPQDLADGKTAKMPEVFDPDQFEIIAVSPLSQVPDFLCRSPAQRDRQRGSWMRRSTKSFSPVRRRDPWNMRLRHGFFKVVTHDGRGELFKVSGAVASDGQARDSEDPCLARR